LLIEWIDYFKKAAFDPVHEPGHVKCRNIGTPGSRDDDLRVQGFRVQGSRVQKKADRLGSHKAGKLVGLKRRKLPGFLASWPSSYELSAMSIFWTQIFADHHRFFIQAFNFYNIPSDLCASVFICVPLF
jgi:hypothetical protein